MGKKGSMIDSLAKKSVEKSVSENSCSFMKKIGRFREGQKYHEVGRNLNKYLTVVQEYEAELKYSKLSNIEIEY